MYVLTKGTLQLPHNSAVEYLFILLILLCMTKIVIKDDTEFSHAIEKLKWVMKCLRDPEQGCPWDKEQDYKSIVKYTIEEAYEVADAIEHGDMADLKEELGDLLLQVIYHTQMSDEDNEFTFDDVAKAIADKMISRHPHVFGDTDTNADTSDDVVDIWEQQKDKEKTHKGALDGVTLGLPALLRAHKLQKKAAKVGYEWPNTADAFAKIEEEIEEFKDAVENSTPEHQEEEFGDLMFCMVNFARMNGINAEESLRKANNKFTKRFAGMEEDCTKNGVIFKDLSLKEMLKYWEQQKSKSL